jgi:hypothetical protein
VRTFAASLQAELDKRARPLHRIHLFDVRRYDGTQYFWSDVEGQFLSFLTGAQQQYKPWVIQPPTITLSRSLSTDGGNFQIQNLSGNTIDREVFAQMQSGEFEGAYIVYRPWFLPLDVEGWEFHGFLSEQTIDQDKVQFRMLQLFQPSSIPAYDFVQTMDCHFRYRSAQCGMRLGTIWVGPLLATITGANTIGSSFLSLTPDLYANEQVMILAGTGAGQTGYILSHTATTFTMKANWGTAPDGTSRFVVTGPGTNKLGAVTTANIFSSTTIGNSGLSRTVNGDTDGRVIVIDGTGAGQERAIVSNTATTFTLNPAWSVTPDGTSKFVVIYQACPKDFASCQSRGVQERFPGIIHLQSQVTANVGPTASGVGGQSPGGGVYGGAGGAAGGLHGEAGL